MTSSLLSPRSETDSPDTNNPPTDIYDLWEAYKSPDGGSQEIRNRLIEHFQPIVRYNAEKICSKLPESVDVNDLISSGNFGLMDAIEAYDLERGVKFETYCVPRIRGAMLDELRVMDWVPRLVRATASKIQRAIEAHQQETGLDPTDAELAERLETDDAGLEVLREKAKIIGVGSLETQRYETDSLRSVRNKDFIADPNATDPTEHMQKDDILRLSTKGLNRNERLLIIMYYYEEMTMKAIGQHLGLSESRVSQMHTAIMARHKDVLRTRKEEFTTNAA